MKLSRTFTELISRDFSTLNSAKDFRRLRQSLRVYGLDRFKQEMIRDHHFTEDGNIDSRTNPFAKILNGQLKVGYSMNLLAEHGLGRYSDRYFIAKNTPANDQNWQNEEFAGKSSMSLNHQFLLIKDAQWSSFNVLTLGMVGDRQKSIYLLNEMEDIALQYAERAFNTTNVGLYFHAFPTNSVQTLHLHIVDLNRAGPSFHHLAYKNLPLAVVRDELRLEVESSL